MQGCGIRARFDGSSCGGVTFTATLEASVTFVPVGRRMLGARLGDGKAEALGPRSLALSSCTATINVPVPPSGSALAASFLSGAVGTASQSALTVVAARMHTLFVTPSATNGVFVALSSAVGALE